MDSIPQKIETIGELIKYLSQFPPENNIWVLDYQGTVREEVYIKDEAIASILTSKGKEVEF